MVLKPVVNLVAMTICEKDEHSLLPTKAERLHTNLVAIATLLHPFSNPSFGFFTLVVVCARSCQPSLHLCGGWLEDKRVNKVAPLLIEIVEHCEGSLLVALAEELLPGLTEVHGTQT